MTLCRNDRSGTYVASVAFADALSRAAARRTYGAQMITTHAPVDAATTMAAPRDEAFVRLVDQMRQYFSLADFLPVGEDAVSPMSEQTARGRPSSASSPTC